jgi:hypothetical protein
MLQVRFVFHQVSRSFRLKALAELVILATQVIAVILVCLVREVEVELEVLEHQAQAQPFSHRGR